MQGIAHAARHLALVALILRALVPAGWMPGATADTPFVICSVDGPVQHAPDGRKPADDGRQHEACPFAATPHLASTPDAPQVALPPVHEAAAVTNTLRAAAIAARFTPQSPRAPPFFA
jgi:Protein of unknown function (DUF2946)